MKQLSSVEHHHPRLPQKALSRMPNRGLKTRRGFILLSWTLLLIVLPLLLLTGLERRWLLALQAQQQQRRYLQALTQSLSALTLAPYLVWQPAGPQWQCHHVEQRQLCLKQRLTCPEMALLRVAPVAPSITDPITLYRFVKQPRVHKATPDREATLSRPVSLEWISGGWLDSCPEQEAVLCQ